MNQFISLPLTFKLRRGATKLQVLVSLSVTVAILMAFGSGSSGISNLHIYAQQDYGYPTIEQTFPDEQDNTLIEDDPTIVPDQNQWQFGSPIFPATVPQNPNNILQASPPSPITQPSSIQQPSPTTTTTTASTLPSSMPTSALPPPSTTLPPSTQYPPGMQMAPDGQYNPSSGFFLPPAGSANPIQSDCDAGNEDCEEEDIEFNIEDFPIDMSPPDIS